MAAVVYIDHGNSATNVAAGAGYGYSLASVIVAANLMAMLVQYLFAKVGVATELDMPELCRKHVPRPVAYGLGGAGGAYRHGDSAALQYLVGLEIWPGAGLRVLEREPFGGPLWVETGGQRRAMGTSLTHLVHGLVQP